MIGEMNKLKSPNIRDKFQKRNPGDVGSRIQAVEDLEEKMW